MFRKIFSVLFAFWMLLTISGCTSDALAQPLNTENALVEEGYYDSKLVETSQAVLEDLYGDLLSPNPFDDGRVYEVFPLGNDTYRIDVNGTERNMQFTSNSDDGYHPTNIKPLTSKSKKLVEKSLGMVLQYVEASTILKDKEELVEYLCSLEICTADFTDDEGTIAYFAGDLNGIFVNGKNVQFLCEWCIVHEYVHAISYFTHGGTFSYSFSYSLFTETLTDLITSTMEPKTVEGNYASGYSLYYPQIYAFIGVFGEDAIFSYFYGYERITSQIAGYELPFMVHIIQYMNPSANSELEVHFSNLILKWASLVR